MVNYDDILTKEEINLMARYIQNTLRMYRRSSPQRHGATLETHRSG